MRRTTSAGAQRTYVDLRIRVHKASRKIRRRNGRLMTTSENWVPDLNYWFRSGTRVGFSPMTLAPARAGAAAPGSAA